MSGSMLHEQTVLNFRTHVQNKSIYKLLNLLEIYAINNLNCLLKYCLILNFANHYLIAIYVFFLQKDSLTWMPSPNCAICRSSPHRAVLPTLPATASDANSDLGFGKFEPEIIESRRKCLMKLKYPFIVRSLDENRAEQQIVVAKTSLIWQLSSQRQCSVWYFFDKALLNIQTSYKGINLSKYKVDQW